MLNSVRYFPSRLNIPDSSLKHFTAIARRLYRIFAHAFLFVFPSASRLWSIFLMPRSNSHHREIFDECEVRFVP